MKSIFKTLIAAVFALTVSGAVLYAQPGRGGFGGRGGVGQTNGYVTGTIKVQSEIEGEEDQPAEGAVVIVSFEKQASNLAQLRANGNKPVTDSLFTQIGSNGQFTIRNVPMGDATIKISLMGYEELVRKVSINPGENKIAVTLTPEKLTLAQSVVTAKVPPLSIIADTVVMNASAVKFNKGEMAIDILEQMPGVEATDGGISILGEAVSQVYVDGVLLFGNSPMTALNNLPAEEVIALKSFQEYANKDPRHKISENESKQRVLDISTRSKAKFVVNGNATVGGGFDTDTTYHKFRYTTGAQVTASSEKLQLNAEVTLNNINSNSIRSRGASFGGGGRSGGSPDLRNLNISLSGTKKWMSKSVKNFVLGQINGSYSYSESYNVSESKSITTYDPVAGRYDFRETTSSSKSVTEQGRHNFSLGVRKNIGDGTASVDASYSFNENLSRSNSSNITAQKLPGVPEIQNNGTITGQNRVTNGDSYSLNANVNKGIANIIRLGVRASVGQSSSDGHSIKIDTTASTLSRTVLNIDSNTPSRNMSFSPNVRVELNTRQSLELSYNLRKTYNKTEQLAYDVTQTYPYAKAEKNWNVDENNPANVMDVINTQTMTNDNLTHSAEVNYSNALWTGGPILRAGLEYSSVKLAKDENYPVDPTSDPHSTAGWTSDPYDHTFNSWSPSLSLGTEGMMNRWNLRYSMSHGTPSLEQVRPRLNNTNLYNVSGGNPNLHMSKTHSVNLSYSSPLGGRSLEESIMSQKISVFTISGGFSLNQGRISSSRRYFEKETDLGTINDEYRGYIMPAGSTFTSYENMPNAYSANFNTMFTTEISPIRSNISMNASMRWDNSPEYIDGELIRGTNIAPNGSVGLRSNFSRNLRFNVNFRGSYNRQIKMYEEKTEVTQSYFTESVDLGAELNNILQKGYVSANYNKQWIQGLERVVANDNILDVRGGLRFGPRNNIDLAVVVHDILNKTTGYSVSTNTDNIRHSWSHNFGRYVMFSITYSFNSLGRKGGSGSDSGQRVPGMFGGGPGMGGGMPPMMMGGGFGGGFGGGRPGGMGGRR